MLGHCVGAGRLRVATAMRSGEMSMHGLQESCAVQQQQGNQRFNQG